MTLIGNVGQDPEFRYTPDGTPVASFPLATHETWTDDDGEKQRRTDWHKVVCFRKLAEIVGEHVSKRRQVCVIGKIRQEKYEDREGVTRWITKILARRVIFLGNKNDGSHPAFEKENGEHDDIPF